MIRLVFYEDPNADPLVEQAAVSCYDDAAMIATSIGDKRADSLVVGDYYRFADGSCRLIDAVEIT
jgi:hypothetical protein